MIIVLHNTYYALGIWKHPVYGRVEHIQDSTVSFREILLYQIGFKKGGNLYQVEKKNLIDESAGNHMMISRFKYSSIKCDRCDKDFPNSPHFIGNFHPSQVKNPDNRLGYYFICKDCIAGKR